MFIFQSNLQWFLPAWILSLTMISFSVLCLCCCVRTCSCIYFVHFGQGETDATLASERREKTAIQTVSRISPHLTSFLSIFFLSRAVRQRVSFFLFSLFIYIYIFYLSYLCLMFPFFFLPLPSFSCVRRRALYLDDVIILFGELNVMQSDAMDKNSNNCNPLPLFFRRPFFFFFETFFFVFHLCSFLFFFFCSFLQRLEQLVAVHRALLRRYGTLELENAEARKQLHLRYIFFFFN